MCFTPLTQYVPYFWNTYFDSGGFLSFALDEFILSNIYCDPDNVFQTNRIRLNLYQHKSNYRRLWSLQVVNFITVNRLDSSSVGCRNSYICLYK